MVLKSESYKVIYLVGNLGSGGLERFVTRVSIKAIEQALFTPVVVCLSAREGIFLAELERAGVQVIQAPQKWQRNILSLIKLGKLMKELNPTVVHSQVNFSMFQQWVATFLAGARFMVTERNMYPLNGFARIRRIIQFYFLKLLGVSYSANSPEVADHLSKQFFFSREKILVIPNGIDLPDLNPEKRLTNRERLGFCQQDFVVGYVARFAPHKGQRYFVHVMKEVYNKIGNRLKICFVGDGPTKHEIQSEIVLFELSQVTRFYGIVSNIEDYYTVFDCVALLSDHEGMPNVVLESMAYGLPVVANPVGNAEALLGSGRGIINYSRDPKITAKYFLELANNPSARKNYGEHSRKEVLHKYSLQNTLDILCREYGFGK